MCGSCKGDGGLPALSRRAFVLGGTAGAGLWLAGCQGGGLDLGDAPGALVSEQEVTALSLQTWQRIKEDTPVADSPEQQQRVARIGRRIVDAAGLGAQDWEFVVFQGEQVNAFALPGGRVGVYQGLLQLAGSDDMLAAVIGHEVGHVTNDHSAERLGASKVAQVGLQAVNAALAAGNLGYANQIAGLLGAGVQYGVILPYGRTQELEADRVGLRYMAQAGYDPRAAVAFWEQMQAAKSGAPPEFASTHPSDARRIQQLQALMPEALEIYRQRSGSA